MSNSKSILVTGASGLIGYAVSRELLGRGYKVIGLDCNDSDFTEFSNSFEFINADISNCDVNEILSGKSIDGIIHCAAHPGGKSLKEPLIDVEVNITGSMKLFKWCYENNAEVVYLSSSAVYGNQPDAPIKEDVTTDPGTIYAICKVANERYLKTLGEGYGLNWKVVRLFATYGAGHKPNKFQGIVNIMLTQLMEGDRIIVKGSLDRVRGLIYVKDAATALVNVLESKEAQGEIINISQEEPHTIKGIIEEIARTLDKDLDSLEIVEEEGTVGDTFYNYPDCEKQKSILGFKPEFNLAAGLRELVNHRLGK